MAGHPSSPLSTGGAGVIFEYDVATIMLSRLLRGASVPVGIQAPVAQVAFQQSNEGYPLDDVVVWGQAEPPFAEPYIQIQVKRSIRATAGDREFAKVLAAVITACDGQPEQIAERRLLFGLAARPSAGDHLGELAELTEIARAHSAHESFGNLFREEVTGKPLRDRLDDVMGAIGAVAGTQDDLTIRRFTHQILRALHVWQVEEGPGSRDWRTELDALADLADVAGKTPGDIMHLLHRVAGQYGPRSGNVNASHLRGELARFGVDVPATIAGARRRAARTTINAVVRQTVIVNHGEDSVEMITVPDADLAACAEGRFVRPRGKWDQAATKLGERGSLILTGERGSGRRTAALRLLDSLDADEPGTDRSIYELVPSWRQPSTAILPEPPGARCLLDMSEPAEKPAPPDFGKRLMDWASEKGLCLVVIAADETGAARWAQSAGEAVVPIRSPDARELASRELRVQGTGEVPATVLDAAAYADIWKSAPKAEHVRWLVQLIVEGPERTPEDIAGEYQGWQQWIDETLPKKELGARALIWAAAFCDGGQRRSVLRMSEDLRQLLLEERGPVDILKDAPSSKRLADAEIKPAGDTACLSPSHHGLAGALRTYLWGEFEDQDLRKILTDWLIAQLEKLPPGDADRTARGVLDIVIRFRDDDLLRALRDKLTGEKHPIAVQLISQAALDPQFGAHVRASLYTWARTSRSHADLVAEVCGGPFGEQQPEMALVRLGWAAQNSRSDSPTLAGALASLARNHPDAVLRSIGKWLADDPPTAGINAFLALASTPAGAELLCDQADPAGGRPGFQTSLAGYFRRSLSEPSSYDATMSVFEAWQKFSDDGTISPQVAIPVLGSALKPALAKNPMRRLHPGFPDMDSFWGHVFRDAIRDEDSDQRTEPDAQAG